MIEEEIKSNNDIEIILQLGDVIHITNPLNEKLNDQVFIIDYIDKQKMYLINTDTFHKIKLKINPDGILGDGNITKIEILSRADSPSYAIQNGLIPGKYVNIYFGGDYPVIISGEITNLEQDMIELTTPDKDILYINFDYKGIPENLPIENIELRENPSEPVKLVEEQVEEQIEEQVEEQVEEPKIELPELEQEKKVIQTEQLEINVPLKDVKEQLREIIVKANQVVFGDEELGPVTQYSNISKKMQQYSIESQLTDLYDDILSNFPDSQRTSRVLNNIHTMVERFKQLRNQYSIFNENQVVTGFSKKTFTHKPLSIWLNELNIQLYWILPVVKNIKKIYNNSDIENDPENDTNNDTIILNFRDDMNSMDDMIKNYISNHLPSDNNQYSALYSDINPYFRPFNYVADDNNNNILIEKDTNANINTIIDNLEEFYSSVYNNFKLRNRRFVITKYALGETKMDTIESTHSKSTNVRVKLTNNDMLSIKSILTLPEQTIRFSKVNLPETNILVKSNLNNIFLNYWQVLKKNTKVNDIFIENINDEIELNENMFANSIKNYVLNIPKDDDSIQNLSKNEIYDKFTNTIIPKTRVLFNLMKKYMNDKLSIVDVVGYLEPFLIYTDDLTFSQYGDIIRFIDEKISNYNKQMIEFSQIFKSIGNIRQPTIVNSKAFTLYNTISETLFNDVFETGYGLNKDNDSFTNSEILWKITKKDYSKLYTTALNIESLKLMFSNDIANLLEAEKTENEEKKNDEKNEKECSNIVIAKMYTSLQALEKDNNVLIYFDKRYDKTNYGIMEKDNKNGGYSEQVIKLSPELLKEFIIQDQISKNKLSETDADYFAETLIDGNKKVIDGQYAILYKGYAENVLDESDYYVRKNNAWVLDETINQNRKVISDEPSILCDLQDKCISVAEKNQEHCERTTTNKMNLQNSLLNDMISEFDAKYKLSKEELEKEYKDTFEYLMSIMPILFRNETNNMLKYNNKRYKLGATLDDDYTNNVASPFSNILNIILSETDFVKKQHYIIKFADKFTHTSTSKLSLLTLPEQQVDNKVPHEHWLYCIKTNTPLLPAFKKQLAVAFVTSPETYRNVLEEIKATIGTVSDDGDWWADKYTGWPICPVDFDVEEGYDEGFKISTRAVIEEEAGNKILSGLSNTTTIKYITPETIIMNNVINALSLAMGINIDNQKEFIINNVLELLSTKVENEDEYKEKIRNAAKKSKSISSYKDYFNKSLLYFTFGLYLIAVQTSIPSVKTRKTHPGCVRSFEGYPFDGQGDYSSVVYLACIAYDIRTSSEPWNVLKRTSPENIQKLIQASINTYIIPLPEVQRKFMEKTEYLLTNPASEIPELHDISNWTDFLPPLVPFKIKSLENISSSFKKGLLNDMKLGGPNQTEKLLVIQSKIILFSLAIQEKIQDIVKTQKAILHTSNNEPYLENACCDSNANQSVIAYFMDKKNDISQFNDIVKNLSNILYDVKMNTESLMFYSDINTKNIYPPLSNTFSEKTIYLAFIFYCKFKSLLPIPQTLLPICTEKPDMSLFLSGYSLDNIIQKLKEEGIDYTNEQFLRLIQLVSRENIIKQSFQNQEISSIAKLTQILDVIEDEEDDYEEGEEPNENRMVDPKLRELLKQAIDTFETASEEYSDEIKSLNNYLIAENKEMLDELIEFVRENASSNITTRDVRQFNNTMQELSIWNCADKEDYLNDKISDDCTYKIIQFYKTYIYNFIKVFPNIILNNVNYDNTRIPKYYQFSEIHNSKLMKFIADYFSKLKPFYNASNIVKILTTIQKEGQNMLLLSENTPCFTSISNQMEEDKKRVLKGILDEKTSIRLFEHYLLRVLMSYIELSDDNNMLMSEIQKPEEIANVVSVDYMEENETKVDLGISFQEKMNTQILSGNKKTLRQKIAELLIAFIDILNNEKDVVDITYDDIQDKIFKIKQKEKNLVTDRLKSMTDEQRDLDTTFKIIKQGIYSKGSQKGLTVYDKDYYEEEQELRDQLEKAERTIRKKNKNVNDNNMNIYVDEYLENEQNAREIDEDAYDISHLNETYDDGNYDGVDAPEEEYEDYADEY